MSTHSLCGIRAVVVLFGAAVCSPAQPVAGVAEALALTGGTIYTDPEAAPIRNGVVLIENGKITTAGTRSGVRLPPGARMLDCSGLTIMAGFWNSHVHFMERKWADAGRIDGPELTAQLQAMLTRYGFTSIFDTGSPWQNTREIRRRVEAGEATGPRIRSTGPILMPKADAFPAAVIAAMGGMLYPVPVVTDAAQAAAEANKLLDAGVDGIKIYAATWFPPVVTMPADAVEVAAAAAHKRGKPAFAHPSNREGMKAAVDAGVDVLVHTAPQAGAWEPPLLEEMKRKHIAVIPTLKLWKYEMRHDRASLAAGFVKEGLGQLRAWRQAGGEILFGTDVGYMDDYDPQDEYAFWIEAGMNLREVLASLTTVPAQRFGDAKRLGRIAPGFAADLVVLRSDPAVNIRALADVAYTLRDGRVIYAATGTK